MPSSDAELLQPSLDESHDLASFDRPWRPWSVVFATFFAQALGGGALLALNYRRLGQPRAAVLCLAGFLALALASVALLVWRGREGLLGRADPDQRLLWRTAVRGIALIPAALVAYHQQRRFDVYLLSGGEPARLLGPALAAVAISAVLNLGLVTAGLAIVGTG